MKRATIFVSLGILALVAVALVVYLQPPSFYGSRIEPPADMGDFTLQSASGPVSTSDFRGRYVILYFGYTSCPDVCPLTLGSVKQALTRLGADAAQFQVIFISVDPARDTPAMLADYTGRFTPDFIGLTGSDTELAVVAKQYGIFYKLNEPDSENGFYTVDHTSSTLVLDRQGQLLLTWPYGLQPNELASDMQALIKIK